MAYTEFDLVTFGSYLLSKERNKSISKHIKDSVNDVDIDKWKSKRKQEDIIWKETSEEVLSN